LRTLSFLGIYILLFSIHPLAGQTGSHFSNGYFIESYTFKDGIPGTSVANIIQSTKGFLWLATHNGLTRYNGYEFKNYQPINKFQREGIFKNFIYTLYEDSKGQIWCGTLNNGVLVFDPKTEKFTQHLNTDSTASIYLDSPWIYNISETTDSSIWISTSAGINQILPDNSFISYFSSTDAPANLPKATQYILPSSSNNIFQSNDKEKVWFHSANEICTIDQQGEISSMLIDEPPYTQISAVANSDDGMLWVALKAVDQKEQVSSILVKANPLTKQVERLEVSLPDDVVISEIHEGPDHQIWLGTWGKGLFLIPHKISSAAIPVSLSPDNDEPNINIWSLTPDCFNNLWIGTWGSGLYKIHLNSKGVDYYELKVGDMPIAPGRMAEDDNGDLWITSNQNCLFQKISKTGKYQTFQVPVNIHSHAPPILAIEEDIWLGTNNGLYQFTPSTKSYQLHKAPFSTKDEVHAMLYKDNKIWCGTLHGSLYHFDIQSKQFVALHEEYTNLGVINDIKITSANILLAITSKGIHKINIKKPEERSFDTRHIGGNSILEDQSGNLWLSTYLSGFQMLNQELTSLKTYTQFNDISLSWTIGTYEDHKGKLWVYTPISIVHFDPSEDQFNTISFLNKFETPYRYSCQGSNGQLFFSTPNGILSLQPDDILTNTASPINVIESFVINNQSIPLQKEVILPHHMNNPVFTFAGLAFSAPEAVNYFYKLEGFNEEWVGIGQQRTARFFNLPPGKYRFLVKTAIGSEKMTTKPASILFKISAPWWKRWWAYTMYVAIVATGIFLLYRFQLNRRLAQEEAERLRALDILKSRMYTNIAHEFRTPLTVIQGMSDQARKYFQQSAILEFDQSIKAIQRNGQQLLKLINQMLDLSRLDADQLQLNLIQDDIVTYLQYILESFHSYAGHKNIRLLFKPEVDQLIVDFDPDKLMHIISNLLSNAIKFTPDGGIVTVKVSVSDNETLSLKVQDSGIGIPPEHQAYIFDRFYQIDNSSTRAGEGTGIGLSLTKELVELMQGSISLDSETGRGSTFTVHLPINRSAPTGKTTYVPIESISGPNEIPNTPIPSNDSDDKPTILIVEDNADVRAYIQACLQHHYQIITANNGAIGINLALESTPDLIISDVMMPVKDGYELCRTLKQNQLTSHIPIILLTAKADEAAKIEGLEGGADAYLSKPFNQKELFVRLRKLIELRKRLQAYYQNARPVAATSSFPQEDAFIKKVQSLLEEHLDDENYNVQLLAQEMNMSRSQVFRKLKALTGKSIVQYIREYRLHRAHQLLQQGGQSISEVAYQVGFKDPAYFSRAYSSLFGVPPSETNK
jgi:signal transduction histidine kinase/DNA-binding response OmpR family regulator/ligand-binding sensor domain-containing protein